MYTNNSRVDGKKLGQTLFSGAKQQDKRQCGGCGVFFTTDIQKLHGHDCVQRRILLEQGG